MLADHDATGRLILESIKLCLQGNHCETTKSEFQCICGFHFTRDHDTIDDGATGSGIDGL